jgi:elongation factor 1-gamma
MSNCVKLTADFSGAAYELVKIGADQKEEYKSKQNKSGLFPYIEVDGHGISESNAIIRYIARLHPDTGLYGKTVFQQAKVDEILDVVQGVQSKMLPVLMAYLGHVKLPQPAFKAMSDAFKDSLNTFETLLGDNEHFVGDSVTIADLRVATLLVYPFKIMMDPGLLKKIPNLVKFVSKWIENEKFTAIFGNHHIAKRPIKVNFLKVEKKKEEKKKAAAPKPKPADKKPENPLDALPKTSLNLNEFKFWFINHVDRPAAFDEFCDSRFDREGWSIWDMKYTKYKGEGELLYKTNNLLNGFLQRAESFGKYAYGTHMIYGDEPNLELKGVWMWRGLEIPQEMIDHPQFEFYVTKKLDIDNLEDRAYIKDMWCSKDGPMADGTVIQNWKYMK